MGQWILGRTSGIPHRIFCRGGWHHKEREPGIGIGLGLCDLFDLFVLRWHCFSIGDWGKRGKW